MKKKKYLPLYQKWMLDGHLGGSNGLCDFFLDYTKSWGVDPKEGYQLFTLMIPTTDKERMSNDGYWGTVSRSWKSQKFCTLRQTIVLFLAAMNNEL